MRIPTKCLSGSVLALFLSPAGISADLSDLSTLYIGEPGSTREREVTGFLDLNVGRLEAASRKGFDPEEAGPYDVVVLDWPQSREARAMRDKGLTPLGEREDWTKPTVLLGSAGLNLAVVWQIRGGSG